MKYFVVHLQTLWPIKYTFVNIVLPFPQFSMYSRLSNKGRATFINF